MAKNNNAVIYLAQKLWKYSRGNRYNIVIYAIMFVFANFMLLTAPLVIGQIFNIIQKEGVSWSNLSRIVFWLVMIVALKIGFWLFHGPGRLLERKNAFLARANYRKYLFEGVLAFPIEWHTEHHSGDTIDKIEKGSQAIFQFSTNTYKIIESIIRFVISFSALVYFDLYSFYILIVMLFFTFFTIIQFDKKLVRQYKEMFSAENKITEKIFDLISNITTIILLRAEKLAASAVYQQIMRPFSLFIASSKINEVKWCIASLSENLMLAMILFTYFYFNLKHGQPILLGTVYILYGYVDRISDTFYKLADIYSDIVSQRSAIFNAEEIANEFPDNTNVQSGLLPSSWKRLELKHLFFSYRSDITDHQHLHDISLSFRKGERIALIGESGGGKTTFLKIVRDLYHPDSGTILSDGKLLMEGFTAISRSIALIPQDPEIFSTTIKENITLEAERSAEKIRKFTDLACFTQVAEQLPKKLNSYIFEKGVNLSGGEKQRLALARGLLACERKEIILLDEPTSSVDAKNEWIIFNNIFREFPHTTIIASMHRLHLLPLFDRIYFFKRGRIAASGTLEEMLADSEEFRKLWKRAQGAKIGK